MELDFQSLGIELSDEQKQSVTAKLNEAFEAQTSGLRGKTQELLGKLNASKTELSEFKSQFEGFDIDAVKSLVAKAGQDEETKLIAEGKLDEVINRRNERFRADVDKQLSAANERAAKAEAFAKRFESKVLADNIRAAVIKAGALPEAAEDFILRAQGTFALNDDGDAVATKDGEVILGKDGKTPLSPLEWAESLRETAPHLWPRAAGAGQTGDRGGKASLKRSEMSPAEVREFQQKNGMQAYLKLPK